MSQRIDSIRHLISCWERRDIEAVLQCLSDDIEYHWHMGSRPVRGREAMRRFLARHADSYKQLCWEIRNHAQNGDLLLVEGYEELWDNTHARTIKQPFMQAFEFSGELVSRWRDYYEPENLAPPKPSADGSAATA